MARELLFHVLRMALTTTEFGKKSEMEAFLWLKSQSPGLVLIEQNFRCRVGEIDLIFLEPRREKWELVFAEVRSRAEASRWGDIALESITFPKQLKLNRTAQIFLQNWKRSQMPWSAIRFDAVVCEKGVWRWYPDAWRG